MIKDVITLGGLLLVYIKRSMTNLPGTLLSVCATLQAIAVLLKLRRGVWAFKLQGFGEMLRSDECCMLGQFRASRSGTCRNDSPAMRRHGSFVYTPYLTHTAAL